MQASIYTYIQPAFRVIDLRIAEQPASIRRIETGVGVCLALVDRQRIDCEVADLMMTDACALELAEKLIQATALKCDYKAMVLGHLNHLRQINDRADLGVTQ